MNPRIKYVLDYFRKLYQVPDEIKIGYGTQDCQVQVYQSDTTHFNLLQSFDVSQVIWKTWKNHKIPILFGQNKIEAILQEDRDYIRINDDILLSAFYFLSGWQEYVYQYHHEDESYPYSESLQAKLGITQEPIVHVYFDILKTAIEKMCNIILQLRSYCGKSFALCLTHDVDKCKTGWVEDGFYSLRHGKMKDLIHIISNRIQGHDTWFKFDDILHLEDQYKAHSTFFFIASQKQSGGENADYRIDEANIQKTITDILEQGYEVGIHGSIGSHLRREQLQQDLGKIDHRVTGSRFHYLSFHNPQTISILEEADIQYDSTLGFAEEIGFRNGVAWPFPLFDCQRNQEKPILEIPLIMMDATLRKYKNEQPEDVFPKIKDLLDCVKHVNGCCALLWHNNYFSNYKFQGWGELYQSILEYTHNEAWLASGEEVYRHSNFLLS
ncbi:polysaccharide deacetylase family protein [bacterium]